MPDEPDFPVNVKGSWHRDVGQFYTLDKHSEGSVFTGYNASGYETYDTTRTAVGEAVYQLKYRANMDKAPILAQLVHQHIVPRFQANIGLVVPMPASNARARQPVSEVAHALANLLGVNAWDNILQRAEAGSAPSLKNMVGWQAKMEALRGRFTLNEGVADEGRWNALLIDDLYDSGASMETAVRLLKSYRKINNVFFVALTRKSKT